ERAPHPRIRELRPARVPADQDIRAKREVEELEVRRVDDPLRLIRARRDVDVDVLGEQLREERRLLRNDPVDVAVEERSTAERRGEGGIGVEDPAVLLRVRYEHERAVPDRALRAVGMLR